MVENAWATIARRTAIVGRAATIGRKRAKRRASIHRYASIALRDGREQRTAESSPGCAEKFRRRSIGRVGESR
ncbi:MAG: hypothetical protein ABEL76_13085, partial [Bradymonadaceae bacterium]